MPIDVLEPVHTRVHPTAETALLLTDINILGIGSMHEYEFKDRSHRGQDSGAIHGAFSKLAGLLRLHRDTLPVILWDDRCLWREKILPQYKRHRWETPEQQAFLQSYLAQAQVMRTLFAQLGFAQASCPNFEADDIAGLICRHLDPAWQITLATRAQRPLALRSACQPRRATQAFRIPCANRVRRLFSPHRRCQTAGRYLLAAHLLWRRPSLWPGRASSRAAHAARCQGDE